MITNLQLLQCAHQHLNDPTIEISFKNHLLSLVHAKEYADKNKISTSRRTNKVDHLATILFPGQKFAFFNRLQIGNLVLRTYSTTVSKYSDDSNVVFRIQDKLLMGRIRAIFTLVKTGTTFLLIDYPTAVHYFSCFINNDEFKYSSIYSCLKKDFSTRLIQTIDIVEKCVYFENPNEKCHFLRFPNLVHSS